MKTHPVWTIATICWLFVLFNIERLIPAINLASFVYVLATVSGLAMLGSHRIRKLPFGLTAGGFVLAWSVGHSLLGYSIDLERLPLALAEVLAVVTSQYLCLKVARNSDQFETTTLQLLEALRACSVPSLRDVEHELVEEIRRARRHERSLMFVSLKPRITTSESIRELLEEMERSLSHEYALGCISRILSESTKSHDIAVRVENHVLMLLPETNSEQATAMSLRIQHDIQEKLGVTVDVDSYEFGTDELTLTGVLDRVRTKAIDPAAPDPLEVYRLERSKTVANSGSELVESVS